MQDKGWLMSHIPLYVYPLAALLVWIGIARCFPRTIRIERLMVMPALMAVLGLRGYLGLFPAAGFVVAAAAMLGAAVGLALGWRHVRGWQVEVDRAARTISLPGDVMMLVIVLASFGFEVVLHYGVESHAGWAAAAMAAPLAAAISALFVGMSAGRNANLACRFAGLAAAR